MVKQSFQEVEEIIIEDLVALKRLGVNNINRINVKEFKGDYQGYFSYRKDIHPKKYRRLIFDKNGYKPYSQDLSEMVGGFLLSLFVDYEKNINLDVINEYLNSERPRDKIEKLINSKKAQ